MNNKILAVLLATVMPWAAWAGRPLASDDAGTAEQGTCQLEGWVEGNGSDRSLVMAPACGIAKDVELGADLTIPRHRDELRAGAGLALKWVPESWKLETAAGALGLGIKLGTAFERPAAQSWRGTEFGALALASLQASDEWTLHANLGAARDRATSVTAGLLNLAVVWTPLEDMLLFAETQANSRASVFGGTVNSAGGRWWAVKDRLGVDLTASRENGAGNGTAWSIGFGWYGITF